MSLSERRRHFGVNDYPNHLSSKIGIKGFESRFLKKVEYRRTLWVHVILTIIMPKKKKSNRTSGGSSDSFHVTPIQNEENEQQEERLVDYMSLQIISSSTPPIKTLQYAPMILLTGDDAYQLGVENGDSVLLLSVMEKKTRLHATARATVYLSSSSSSLSTTSMNPTTPTSKTAKSPIAALGGRGSTSNNRPLLGSKLSPGYCHVYPTSLAQHLRGMEETTANNNKEEMTKVPILPSTPTATTTTTTTTTPSPSTAKTPFSFGKSGTMTMTGIQMGTPPSYNKTPQQKKNQMTTRREEEEELLWIIPVESYLGKLLTTRLCRQAQEVSIQTNSKILLDCSTTSSLSSSSSLSPSLGSLLVRAHLSTRYISVNTSISISCQGVNTPCQIQEILPSSTKEDEVNNALEEGIAQLSLDSTLEPIAHDLLSLVANPAIARGAHLLYQVTNETTIRILDIGSDISGTTTSSPDTPPTSLVAGLEDTINKVTNLLLTSLRYPELFQQTKDSVLRPPKGVLLYGSSGSGKSTLATQVTQALKYHHNVHVHHIPCSRLQARTAVVGQAEQELVHHFEMAANSRIGSASLLVMDDVHLICPRRQGMNVGADRLAATLLALLDGVDSQSSSSTLRPTLYHPVMILAITNNPAVLDPALRRPGRLDVEVEVPLPDEPIIRSQIMKFQLKSLDANLDLSDDSEEWIRLARLAKGFTGADLQLAVKEAIRLSFFRSNPRPQSASKGLVDIHDMESAIRSIKPSAIKSVTVEIPKVHWSSIGGMEDVKRQLREAIELPITHGSMFQQLGIRPPRGVLLYGPPGCSKTLMARALATEGHMNFLAVKGPELLSKWLGESERALSSLFRRARLASPAIIFFDEVDAIATKRGGGNSGGGERLLSQLLTELDGIQTGGNEIETKKRVVVVCATNRPDLLDGALMRPGRLDRMIYVGVPDHESRKKILEIGLKDKACDGDIDVSRLWRTTAVDGRRLFLTPFLTVHSPGKRRD